MPYQDRHRPDPSAARPAKVRKPIAVALQYELDGPSLPRVVASGQGRMAEQILEMAFASGVKVREDADLAIGDTRVALQAGGVIDLAGLDDRVASICAGLEAQPHETARVLMPKLTLLVQDLTMLSTACAQVQADTELALGDRLTGELDDGGADTADR